MIGVCLAGGFFWLSGRAFEINIESLIYIRAEDTYIACSYFWNSINVSAGHMGKIETGSKGVSIDLMIEIAETFHVSLDYLVMGKEPATEILRHKIRSKIESSK